MLAINEQRLPSRQMQGSRSVEEGTEKDGEDIVLMIYIDQTTNDDMGKAGTIRPVFEISACDSYLSLYMYELCTRRQCSM